MTRMSLSCHQFLFAHLSILLLLPPTFETFIFLAIVSYKPLKTMDIVAAPGHRQRLRRKQFHLVELAACGASSGRQMAHSARLSFLSSLSRS